MSWHPRHPRRPPHGQPAGERWSRAPEPNPGERAWPALPSPRPPEHRPDDRPVLIVDDDDFGRETLAQILEAAGYRAQRAATGDEALRVLAGRCRVGLIVLDLLMPGLSGWEFVRRKQADARLAGIPVIVVSAEDGSALGDENPGVVAHFQKPVPVRDLLAAIRRHLPH
jgi:CheY-like chemotaxis protein